MNRLAYLIVVIILLSIACSLTPSELTNPDSLATLVAGTMQAAGENALAIATSVASTIEAGTIDELSIQETQTALVDPYKTGTVNGSVCYPSEVIPNMIVYFENKTTREVTSIPISNNQSEFSAPLPPGTYVAYAWLRDYSSGGTYSEAVVCGLSVECTNHSMIEFEVSTGKEVNDVEICDWYVSPSEIPYPPGIKYNQIHGAISGSLGYPSEFIPAMTVVATNLGTNQFYYVETETNDSSYKIEHLPAGDYYVVAYPQSQDLGPGFEDFGGGYSEFVPCGLSVECSDHSLIIIEVEAGQETVGVDPIDFYVPAGTFPPNPVK